MNKKSKVENHINFLAKSMKTYKKELLSIAIGFGFFYTCLNLVCGQDIFVGLKNAQGEKTPFKQLFSKATTGEISGEKYFKLINNEKKAFALDKAFPLDSGSLSFDLIMEDNPTMDMNFHQLLMVADKGMYFLVSYYHSDNSLRLAFLNQNQPHKTSKELSLKLPWSKGKKESISVFWEKEGDKYKITLLGDNKVAECYISETLFAQYATLYIGSDPWNKTFRVANSGIGNVVISNDKYIPPALDKIIFEKPQSCTEADCVATIFAPKGFTQINAIDDDICYGFNNDLHTYWWSPPGNKEKNILIDMKLPSTISGWKIAATMNAPNSKIMADNNRQLFRTAAGYSVEISDDGQNWCKIYELEPDSKVYLGKFHEVKLPKTVSARFIRFSPGEKNIYGLGVIADMILFDKNGEEIDSCRRLRKLNLLRTQLREAEQNIAYSGKSAKYLRENNDMNVPDNNISEIKNKLTELKNIIEKAASVSDKQIDEMTQKTDALCAQSKRIREDADKWVHVAVMPVLAETAQRRFKAMGSPQKLLIVLRQLEKTASEGKPEKIKDFDELAAKIADDFSKYCADNKSYIRQDGRFWERQDGSKLIPFGLNYYLGRWITTMREKDPVAFFPCELMYDESDFRNLCLFGFNTIRLVVGTDSMGVELPENKINEEYINHLKRIIEYCYKYDINVIMDIHTHANQFLSWAPTGQEGPASAAEGFLKIVFREFAKIGKNQPNLIGYEFLSNESNLDRGFDWALDNPAEDLYTNTKNIRKYWNGWLKNKYKTRQALCDAWRNTDKFQKENTLTDAENWDDCTILAPHEILRKYPEMDYTDVTRLYDLYECASACYSEVMERLINEVKSIDPDHLYIYKVNHDFQRVALKGLNKSYPASCTWMYDIRPANVNGLGDHYATVSMARKFRGTGLPWYAGEAWIFDNTKDFAEMLFCGGGPLGWAYCAGDNFSTVIGRDRWIRNNWLKWPAVSWYFNHADGFQDADLAIVVSPLCPDKGYERIAPYLNEINANYDLITSISVLNNPAMLNRYKAVILNLNLMDKNAVDAIVKYCKKPVLMVGRLDFDIRSTDGGVMPALKNVFFRKRLQRKKIEENCHEGDVNLERPWFFILDPDNQGKSKGFPSLKKFKGWQTIPVPGAWEKETIGQGRYTTYDGVAWYGTNVVIPPKMKDRDLMFYAGAIDDTDEVYFNGNKIGETSSSTPNSWNVERKYRIPRSIVQFNAENTIIVRVNDLGGDGGITRGPVAIRQWNLGDAVLHLNRNFGAVRKGEYGNILFTQDMGNIAANEILQDVEEVASFGAPGHPALLKKDNFYLFLGGNGISLDANNLSEQVLLSAFITEANVKCVYPPTEDSKNINIYRFKQFYLFANNSSGEVTIDVNKYSGNRKIKWYQVMKAPYKKINDSPKSPLVIPGNSFAGVAFE